MSTTEQFNRTMQHYISEAVGITSRGAGCIAWRTLQKAADHDFKKFSPRRHDLIMRVLMEMKSADYQTNFMLCYVYKNELYTIRKGNDLDNILHKPNKYLFNAANGTQYKTVEYLYNWNLTCADFDAMPRRSVNVISGIIEKIPNTK